MWRKILTDIVHFIYGVLTVFAPGVVPLVMFLAFALYEVLEYVERCNDVTNDLIEYMLGVVTGALCSYVFA